MTDGALASQAASTGGIAIPAAPHVVGAPLEPAVPVEPPETATVLARTTAHIRGHWTVIDPPIKIAQLESRGSYFTVLVAPECELPEIGDRVRLQVRTFADNVEGSFDALVVVGRILGGPDVTAYVVGTAVSAFTRRPSGRLFELADGAVSSALADAGLQARDIEEVFIGSGAGAPTIGAKLMEHLGFVGIPVTRVEQACASGSTAARMALDAVDGGRRRHVLAIGLDELRQGVLDLSDPHDPEALLGLNLLPAYFALKTDQYLDKYGLTVEDVARVAVHTKKAAVLNPNAAYPGDLTVEDVQGSTLIADPLTKLHCCGNASGAAAAVVSSSRTNDAAVRALAWQQTFTAADPTGVPDGGRDDLERTVEALAVDVYERARIRPADIDVVQINDAFTVCGPLYVEALGLAEHGGGLELFSGTSSGLQVNTDGGLLGRGHCLGATGLAMVHAVRTQLSGNPDAEIGLVQSHGLGADLLFCFASA